MTKREELDGPPPWRLTPRSRQLSPEPQPPSSPSPAARYDTKKQRDTEPEGYGRAILSVPVGAGNCRCASEGCLGPVGAGKPEEVRSQKALGGHFCPYLPEQEIADVPLRAVRGRSEPESRKRYGARRAWEGDFVRTCPTTALEEQQLAVFREGPELVIDHQLYAVDALADLIHHRHDGVVVGQGLLALGGYDIGHLAALHQLRHEAAYIGEILRQHLDKGDIFGRIAVPLLLAEHGLHLDDIVEDGTLVLGGDRDDMVEGQVAYDAGLNLYLLGVGAPLDLVAGMQLGLIHHARA